MVAHSFYPNIQEAEADRILEFEAHPGLHSEFQDRKQNVQSFHLKGGKNVCLTWPVNHLSKNVTSQHPIQWDF